MDSKIFIVILVLVNTVKATESNAISFKVGDHLNIPGGLKTPVNHILWKHIITNNTYKVVEWDNDFKTSVYGDFKSRTTLDIVTGDISIRDLRPSDSGIYNFEFNYALHKTFNISVIDEVPTPATAVNASGISSKTLIGISVFVLLVTVIIVLVFIHKYKSGVWFYETESMPWEAGFWRQQGNCGDQEPPGIMPEPQVNAGVVENGEGPKEEDKLMT